MLRLVQRALSTSTGSLGASESPEISEWQDTAPVTCAERVRSQFHLLQIQKRPRWDLCQGQRHLSSGFFVTQVTGRLSPRQTLEWCSSTAAGHCDLLVLHHQCWARAQDRNLEAPTASSWLVLPGCTRASAEPTAPPGLQDCSQPSQPRTRLQGLLCESEQLDSQGRLGAVLAPVPPAQAKGTTACVWPL